MPKIRENNVKPILNLVMKVSTFPFNFLPKIYGDCMVNHMYPTSHF